MESRFIWNASEHSISARESGHFWEWDGSWQRGRTRWDQSHPPQAYPKLGHRVRVGCERVEEWRWSTGGGSGGGDSGGSSGGGV